MGDRALDQREELLHVSGERPSDVPAAELDEYSSLFLNMYFT
jgi:hypothetical protein